MKVLKIFERFGNLIHIVISVAIILLLTYFFGHKILTGGLIGNDTPNGMTFILWLDRFFPKIPLLFPLQGSGISFVQGYQVLPLLLVVWFHRFSSFSLIQSLEILSFLSVLLSAVGVYFLGFFRFKSQTIGLIASIFFLLIPATWVWTTQAGFYSSAFSMIFFAPAFLFTDWYFDFVFEETESKYKKPVFILAVLFLALSLLSHFTTFMALLLVSVFYYGIYAFIKDKFIFKNIINALWGGVSLYGFSVLVSAFWFFSFYTYNSFANWDGSNNPNPLMFPKINVESFLSIPQEVFKVSSVWTFSFPIYVWVLSLLAIVISLFYSRKMLALSLSMGFTLFASVSIGFYQLVASKSAFLSSAFSPRIFWISYNILAPILASWCLFAIFGLIPKFLKLKILYPLVSVLVILTSGYLIVNYRSVDKNKASSYAHYGSVFTYPYLFKSFDAGRIYGAGLDLRDIWQTRMKNTSSNDKFSGTECLYQADRETVDKCEAEGVVANWPDFLGQLKFKNWPKFEIRDLDLSIPDKRYPIDYSVFPKNKNIRVDFSPNAYGGLLASFHNYRQDVSLINSYTFQLPLNHVFWSNSQGIFYSYEGKNIYNTASVLNEEAKYFGVYGILLGEKDPHDKYKKAGWDVQNVGKESYLAKPASESGLIDITNKPTALLIGQKKYNTFESFYNISIEGAISYDKANVVMGKELIDSYSLSELSKYEVLVLQAYNYNSKSKANKLLKSYVENGGSLYIDTGWQYAVPDWQTDDPLDVIPLNKLEWKNLPLDSNYSIDGFSPLKWGDKSWGVSTSNSLKPWAKTVLEYAGYPLIVEGQIGKGKVVWSGMNLISHAHDTDSKFETEFLASKFDYLIGSPDLIKINTSADFTNPDKVTITVNDNLSSNGNLFFKFAYSPNWVGTLKTVNANKKLILNRGGAGMIFANLPDGIKSGDKIILEYKLTNFQRLGYLVSIIAIIGLFVFNHKPIKLTKVDLSKHIKKFSLGSEDD